MYKIEIFIFVTITILTIRKLAIEHADIGTISATKPGVLSKIKKYIGKRKVK